MSNNRNTTAKAAVEPCVRHSVAYRLGFEHSRLRFLVEVNWLLADEDEPVPDCFSQQQEKLQRLLDDLPANSEYNQLVM